MNIHLGEGKTVLRSDRRGKAKGEGTRIFFPPPAKEESSLAEVGGRREKEVIHINNFLSLLLRLGMCPPPAIARNEKRRPVYLRGRGNEKEGKIHRNIVPQFP